MAKLLVSAMNHAPELTGCGKYTGELAEEMAKRGHEVELVTTPPHYPGWTVQAPYRNRYSHEHRGGVSVHRCPVTIRSRMGGIWRVIAPISFALTSAPVTIRWALKLRPDTILSVEPTLFAAPFVLLAARLVGARSVLHVQDLEVDAAFAVGHLGETPLLKRLGRAFEHFCMSRFDAVVTISQKMVERIVDKGVSAERVSIVRNWVDLEHIRPVEKSLAYRDELGLPRDAFVVLYSGNIGPKQGLDVVVEAARRLSGRPDVVFAIAGEGPSKEGLRARAADLPSVRFLGFQPYARLPDFFGACDLHVLPQQARAGDLVLPSKLGGMLASGRPIVVTAEPDTELGLFLEGAATVVAPGDAAALAEAIAAHADGAIEDAQSTRLALAAHLSLPGAMERLEAVFFDSAGDRPTGVTPRERSTEGGRCSN